MSTKKEAACYSVRAGAVAGGWCRLSWTRGAAAGWGSEAVRLRGPRVFNTLIFILG